MLTRELMGGLALAILWVNALLIAATAAREAGARWKLLQALRPLSPEGGGTGLVHGRVEQGDGPGGTIARWEVQQLGRAGAEAGGRRTILFGDRAFGSAVLGGVIVVGETRVHVAATEGEIWPDRAALTDAAACSGTAHFDGAFEAARKARGHARTVTAELRANHPVWLAGEVITTDSGCEIRASADLGLLVSAIDPRPWLRRAAALAAGFALAELVVAAALTVLVLVPPVFDGWPSTVGGVLCLGFFLGVQPLGTAVRDALRPPSRAFVRGRWIEPTARASSAEAATR